MSEITNEERALLRFPGSVEGVLRRWTPITDEDGDEDGCVVWLEEDGRGLCYRSHLGRALAYPEEMPTPGVSLLNATGRAHLAWWLASRVAEIPCTAMWDGTPDGSEDRVGIWRLRYRSLSWPNHPACTGCHPYTPRLETYLSTLDPDDPRLLPDGSRLVDALALSLVARHVAGVGNGQD